LSKADRLEDGWAIVLKARNDGFDCGYTGGLVESDEGWGIYITGLDGSVDWDGSGRGEGGHII
jgi:hypothetical protein